MTLIPVYLVIVAATSWATNNSQSVAVEKIPEATMSDCQKAVHQLRPVDRVSLVASCVETGYE